MNEYSKFPSICSLHDFVFTKNTIQDKVVAKVRKFCYGGTSENDKIHVFSSKNTSMYAIPDQEHENYKSLGKLRCLSDS